MQNGHHYRSSSASHVFIVDDHPTVREALSYAIEDQIDLHVCGTSASAQEAFSLIEKTRPDVAIIDLMLNDSHGLDLIHNLAAVMPQIKLIVFSLFDEGVYAERALNAGAMGYLMKNAPTNEVISAIRTVLRGDVFLSSAMTSRLVQRHLSGTPETGSTVDQLTNRELEIVQMLGHGFGVNEIVERLHISRKTVETYRRRAADKLGFQSSNELLRFAMRWVDRSLSGIGN